MTRSAVVLLSGGMDSAVVLALAQERGFAVSALSFSYGQRHGLELGAAALIAHKAGVERHLTMNIDTRAFSNTSSLISDLELPTGRQPADMDDIPNTYVPARNTIFLSFALAWSESLSCHDIFVGMNALDYAGYPDCRPGYVAAYERMANLATAVGVKGTPLVIHTPVIWMTKADIVTQGMRLGVDFASTISCYAITADGACGDCDACVLRRLGFKDAGVPDPTVYR